MQSKNDLLIKEFVNGFLDKRTSSYKNLKAADNLCREYIEKRLAENQDIKKLINNTDQKWGWIKELIVNYTLLKMHHHAVLWEINDHKPKLQETPHDKAHSSEP